MTMRRRTNPLLIGALITAGFANRHDLRRWGRFVHRSLRSRRTRPFSDLLTEVRVRASVSTDTLLRRDRSLLDLTVTNGVVTLITTSTPWPATSAHVLRLDRVKGINAVISQRSSP